MKYYKKFVPVMLMPFTSSGAIDYPTLDRLIDYYIASGASGLFANCLSSEMFDLSPSEMIESVKHIVERVKGRVPVVATGSFGQSLEQQADMIGKIHQTGVSGVIIITSLLASVLDSNVVFKENVEKLLALTGDIPVGFYECPVPYKRLMDPEFLAHIVESGRVKYYKDTSLDIHSVTQKVQKSAHQKDFELYDAYMVNAVASLEQGAAGLSCIQGNYFPELVVWLCDNYENPDLQDQVARVQAFFTDNMDVMHEHYPASAKYILNKRGLAMDLYCRNGSVISEKGAFEELDALLERYNQLVESIDYMLEK